MFQPALRFMIYVFASSLARFSSKNIDRKYFNWEIAFRAELIKRRLYEMKMFFMKTTRFQHKCFRLCISDDNSR